MSDVEVLGIRLVVWQKEIFCSRHCRLQCNVVDPPIEVKIRHIGIYRYVYLALASEGE